VAVNAFAFLLAAQLLSRRSRDPLAVAAAATVVVLQLACTYVPALNGLFGTVPVGGGSWPALIAVAIADVALLSKAATSLGMPRSGKDAGDPADGGETAPGPRPMPPAR
jgi:hypothetical protein